MAEQITPYGRAQLIRELTELRDQAKRDMDHEAEYLEYGRALWNRAQFHAYREATSKALRIDTETADHKHKKMWEALREHITQHREANQAAAVNHLNAGLLGKAAALLDEVGSADLALGFMHEIEADHAND